MPVQSAISTAEFAVSGSKELVELVGIEPTTSSLRILNPVRDDDTPKKSE